MRRIVVCNAVAPQDDARLGVGLRSGESGCEQDADNGGGFVEEHSDKI